MTVYEPGIDSDLLVLNWWHQMATTGDLERAFTVNLAPCGAFMAEMRKVMLVYEADADGIWFAAWFEPMLSAGSYGLWIREAKRHNADAMRQVIESLHLGLERFPVLVFATMHDRVVEQGKRFGFQVMGVVPHLFDGEPATLAWLDAEHFYAAVAPYMHLFGEESQS